MSPAGLSLSRLLLSSAGLRLTRQRSCYHSFAPLAASRATRSARRLAARFCSAVTVRAKIYLHILREFLEVRFLSL